MSNSAKIMDDAQYRYVIANDKGANAAKNFCTNFIVTSKYTKWSFLPKFMFETFRKVANAYFLVVSVLQCIPRISNTDGLPSTLPTLLFIVAIDAVFAILEDRKRHQADDIANSRLTQVLDPVSKSFVKVTWAEVKVGDILKLENRDGVPADLMILSVSEPDNAPPAGICYVETKSLDGETNLKLRQAMDSTMTVSGAENLVNFNATVQCETPNNAINKFTGTLEKAGGEKEPIPARCILLRGCVVRNTEWVCGLVLNTGNDTKIMMSNTATPSKMSTMDSSINHYIVLLVGFLVACCVLAATGYVIWNESYADTWYLGHWKPDVVTEWIVMFFYSFLLLYQYVPIALYVSMSMVKYCQAQFMNWDLGMYHAESDRPALVRTMALNEELGQISYIFSDKTGTLTCNVMEFRKCSIGGVSYGHGSTEIGIAAMKREGRLPPGVDFTERKEECIAPFVNFDSPELSKDLDGDDEQQKNRIHNFFMHLAICHTVIPEKREGSDEITLSASSPDEQALVAGAKFLGYEFVARGPGFVKIKVHGKEPETYEVVDVLEFNSTRKRMSLVAKLPNGKYQLFTKGADAVIFPRLNANCKTLELKCTKHMDSYASEGLRTLAIAIRDLDSEYYHNWTTRYDAALSSISEIEKRKQGEDNLIDHCMDEIESDLELLGATAIEDKLQEGVPDAIANLAEAGVKIWVLTGDKEETAINIGFACRLLDSDMRTVIVNADTCPTAESLSKELERHIAVRAVEVRKFEQTPPAGRKNAPKDLALVIDGESLDVALTGACRQLLLEFSQFCKAVVACRVSPAQKAEMVALIRQNVPGVRTLAIGDGANDVSMIQEAHVGVGISGEEGMQAVNASDYAIARFRFLERLLLVHGRSNYMRMSILVVYMFYKNIMLSAAQYWFSFESGYAGQKFYLELGVQIYNVALTSMPIVALAIFDTDVSDEMATKFPKLFYPGPQDFWLNSKVFFKWVISAIFESIGITVLCVLGTDNVDKHGRDAGMFFLGTIVFSAVVIVTNMKLMLSQYRYTWFNHCLYALSVINWFACAVVASHLTFLGGASWDSMMEHTADIAVFYLLLLLIPVALLGPSLFWKGYCATFRPEYNDLAMEVEKFKLNSAFLEWKDPSQAALPMPFDFDPHFKDSAAPYQSIDELPTSPTIKLVDKKLKEKQKRGFAFSSDGAASSVERDMALPRSRGSCSNLPIVNVQPPGSIVSPRRVSSDRVCTTKLLDTT